MQRPPIPARRAGGLYVLPADLEFETTAWLGISDSNCRIRPRATQLDLRDNLAEVGASPAAETVRVRAA